MHRISRAWVASAVARRGNLRCSKVRLSMADSKMGNASATETASISCSDAKHGLLVKACAFIAKYEKEGGKVRLRISDSGVHKKSRGGEYPSGSRVQELLRTITFDGIVQEEADHNCIAVEEMPLPETLLRQGFVSTLDYNIQQCEKDPLLRGIYHDPNNKAHYALLSHNHLMTICRAFLAKQLWRLAAIWVPRRWSLVGF